MIRSSTPRTRQFKVVSLAAASLLIAIVTASPSNAQVTPQSASAGTVDATNTIPGVDEIASSPNLRQIANLPKQAPLNATNTDIAFQGKYAFVGNYNGFAIYDIARPSAPASYRRCSAPARRTTSRSTATCSSSPPTPRAATTPATASRSPRPSRSPGRASRSSTSATRPTRATSRPSRPTAARTPTPSSRPRTAPGLPLRVLVLPDGHVPRLPAAARRHLDHQGAAGRPDRRGGRGHPEPLPGRREQGSNTSATTGCHDITAYPAKDLAAGACMGDGILMDIADREAPRVIDRVRDTKNFAFWHSATFNNSGTKVVFTDELGGGGAATCNATVGPDRGADAIYDIAGSGDDRTLVFRSYYKIPRDNADTENCVAHNGSLIPVQGRDIMVQSWYQGGVSVWDFTDSGQAEGDRLLGARPGQRRPAELRRHLVGVLLQRLHLLQRPEGPGRPGDRRRVDPRREVEALQPAQRADPGSSTGTDRRAHRARPRRGRARSCADSAHRKPVRAIPAGRGDQPHLPERRPYVTDQRVSACRTSSRICNAAGASTLPSARSSAAAMTP